MANGKVTTASAPILFLHVTAPDLNNKSRERTMQLTSTRGSLGAENELKRRWMIPSGVFILATHHGVRSYPSVCRTPRVLSLTVFRSACSCRSCSSHALRHLCSCLRWSCSFRPCSRILLPDRAARFRFCNLVAFRVLLFAHLCCATRSRNAPPLTIRCFHHGSLAGHHPSPPLRSSFTCRGIRPTERSQSHLPRHFHPLLRISVPVLCPVLSPWGRRLGGLPLANRGLFPRGHHFQSHLHPVNRTANKLNHHIVHRRNTRPIGSFTL